MIRFVIQAKKNPLKKEEVKFYPQAAPTTPVTLAQIVKRIEKRSTVSSADVKAVLDALKYEVIEALKNGNTVHLTTNIKTSCIQASETRCRNSDVSTSPKKLRTNH